MNEYNIIGDRYFNGDGVEQNYEIAFNNYIKAAEMMDPEGYSNLAWCYEHGLGTEKSETNAIVNYTKAGEMGLAKAWRNLAFMLFFSVTDDDDPKLVESFKYMLKAADMGDADAQAHIAQAYQGGSGWGAPETNFDKAKKYLSMAVAQKNEHAMWVLAENYSTGRFGYEENPELALLYYRKAAEAGSSKAMHDIAIIAYFGFNGVEKNPKDALFWERKAYREGDINDTTVMLGALLMHGIDTESAENDYQTGKKMIENCCGKGLALADYLYYRIGIIESAFGNLSYEMIENLLYLAYVIDHHPEYERDEKEILVEAQAPRLINMALDGDFDACVGLSRVFLAHTKDNDAFGGDKISSLQLNEKWAEQSYKCDPDRGTDVYIATLALLGHIEYQIGAFDASENKLVKLCQLLEETKTLEKYDGFGNDPEKCAEYYTDCAFSQIETGNYNGAYNSILKANQECVISDSLYGMFKLYSTEEFAYYDWGKAVDCIQKSSSINNWKNANRNGEAHYILGMIYKDPAFNSLARTDINKSYEMMVKAADLGFNPAKEELEHYKKSVFGGYKYV